MGASTARNAPAVCRKAYIHPGVLALGEALADEAARGQLRDQAWVTRRPARRDLGVHERRLLGLLKASAAKRPPRVRAASRTSANRHR